MISVKELHNLNQNEKYWVKMNLGEVVLISYDSFLGWAKDTDPDNVYKIFTYDVDTIIYKQDHPEYYL